MYFKKPYLRVLATSRSGTPFCNKKEMLERENSKPTRSDVTLDSQSSKFPITDDLLKILPKKQKHKLKTTLNVLALFAINAKSNKYCEI